ncbi:tol-pal system protein YbgF [Desulfurispira natronophila]|uniref:Tol-pal system protein YbgF n=1 Tax=Desulfurispira natronophila TaxID=682562 RepID=A0A7W8DGX3_9BACT|nr:tol-pal system protein YbgF [Desulfurispira natronophila]MBB5021900.1 tol-pal system protein YbgF [Desulfurispira natronophila]
MKQDGKYRILIRSLIMMTIFLFMTGCALKGDSGEQDPSRNPHNVPLQVQVDQLRMDVANLHRINQNLARENANMRQQLNNNTVNIDYLRNMVAPATAQLDAQQARNEALQEQISELQDEVELLGGKIEKAARAPRKDESQATLQPRLVTPPGQTPQQPAGRSELDFEDYTADPTPLYDQAMNFYRVGEFQQALIAFDQIHSNFPTSSVADNALYWIGEIYYAQADYSTAYDYFDRVIRQYPEGSKVPDAYLKKGFSLQRQGKYAEALDVLRHTAETYPDHSVLPLAEDMIQNIEGS